MWALRLRPYGDCADGVKKDNKKNKQTKRNGPKFPVLAVPVGKPKRKCRMFATSLVHTLAGVSVLRLKLVAMEIANAKDVQIHLGKVKLVKQRGSAHRGNDESLIFKTRSNLSQKHI